MEKKSNGKYRLLTSDVIPPRVLRNSQSIAPDFIRDLTTPSSIHPILHLIPSAKCCITSRSACFCSAYSRLPSFSISIMAAAFAKPSMLRQVCISLPAKRCFTTSSSIASKPVFQSFAKPAQPSFGRSRSLLQSRTLGALSQQTRVAAFHSTAKRDLLPPGPREFSLWLQLDMDMN